MFHLQYFCFHFLLDGTWSEWSDWGECSLACGGGYMFRQRVCSPPANGGKLCPGDDKENRLCNTQKCDGMLYNL